MLVSVWFIFRIVKKISVNKKNNVNLLWNIIGEMWLRVWLS